MEMVRNAKQVIEVNIIVIRLFLERVVLVFLLGILGVVKHVVVPVRRVLRVGG